VLSVDDYVNRAGPRLEAEGFFEREIHRTVEQYGNILHAFSTYESRRTADLSESPCQRHQLHPTPQGWKPLVGCLDILGQRTARNEIPSKYLPQGGVQGSNAFSYQVKQRWPIGRPVSVRRSSVVALHERPPAPLRGTPNR
jgi:hypothetical protein